MQKTIENCYGIFLATVKHTEEDSVLVFQQFLQCKAEVAVFTCGCELPNLWHSQCVSYCFAHCRTRRIVSCFDAFRTQR